jgi:hypothetical protein
MSEFQKKEEKIKAWKAPPKGYTDECVYAKLKYNKEIYTVWKEQTIDYKTKIGGDVRLYIYLEENGETKKKNVTYLTKEMYQ